MLDDTLLYHVMLHIDVKTLNKMRLVSKLSYTICGDKHFQINKAIIDLKKEFDIITIIDNDTYTYKSLRDVVDVVSVGDNPYEFIKYRRSVLTSKAKCFEIPIDIYNPETPQDSADFDKINSKSLDYVRSLGIRRGDLCHLQFCDDRDDIDDLFIYDGRTILKFNGVCEGLYVIEEFACNYWSKYIYSNSHVVHYKLSENEIQEATKYINRINNKGESMYIYFHRRNIKYTIFIQNIQYKKHDLSLVQYAILKHLRSSDKYTYMKFYGNKYLFLPLHINKQTELDYIDRTK